MLNKLIERIEIGQEKILEGEKQQEVLIVWRFMGKLRVYQGAG